MAAPDLFSWQPPPAYPDSPGYKAPGPSQEAAEQVSEDAATLRGKALDILKASSLTADEVASRLDRNILSIRPRLSELRTKGLIRDTGERRTNISGKSATVWRAV